MARVTGIGGVFFKSRAEGSRLAAWYHEHLGIPLESWGGAILRWPDDKAVDGGDGKDSIKSGAGRDEVNGRAGNDLIITGAGRDKVNGGRDNDRLRPGPGKDRVVGGPGNDKIVAVGLDRDRIRCGGGTDRVRADVRDRVSRSCERVKRVK